MYGPEVPLWDGLVESLPGSTGGVRPVQPVAGRGDVRARTGDVELVDVVVDTLTTFGPGLAAVRADVNAAHLNGSHHPIGTVGATGIEVNVADLCEVLVAGQSPPRARGQLLKSIEFLSLECPRVGGKERRRASSRDQSLWSRPDRVHPLLWNAEIVPAVLGLTVQFRPGRREHMLVESSEPHDPPRFEGPAGLAARRRESVDPVVASDVHTPEQGRRQ